MVPAQCLQRTVQVRTPSGFGTAFTIDVDRRQWLVTARHVVEGFDDAQLSIHSGDPVDVTLSSIPPANGADIAVFELSCDITPQDMPLEPTSGGIVFTQDVYFLGYPYGLGMIGSTTQLPFVKKAIVSAYDVVEGINIWYLDGINNPGFSGGPVVFNRHGSVEWQVVAVVSGYRVEQVSVAGGAGLVPMNTGIVVAYDIKHAIEAIDSHTR